MLFSSLRKKGGNFVVILLTPKGKIVVIKLAAAINMRTKPDSSGFNKSGCINYKVQSQLRQRYR